MSNDELHTLLEFRLAEYDKVPDPEPTEPSENTELESQTEDLKDFCQNSE